LRAFNPVFFPIVSIFVSTALLIHSFLGFRCSLVSLGSFHGFAAKVIELIDRLPDAARYEVAISIDSALDRMVG